MKGYVYAVTRNNPDGHPNLTRIKIGFFAKLDLEQQIYK